MSATDSIKQIIEGDKSFYDFMARFENETIDGVNFEERAREINAFLSERKNTLAQDGTALDRAMAAYQKTIDDLRKAGIQQTHLIRILEGAKPVFEQYDRRMANCEMQMRFYDALREKMLNSLKDGYANNWRPELDKQIKADLMDLRTAVNAFFEKYGVKK